MRTSTSLGMIPESMLQKLEYLLVKTASVAIKKEYKNMDEVKREENMQ